MSKNDEKIMYMQIAKGTKECVSILVQEIDHLLGTHFLIEKLMWRAPLQTKVNLRYTI